MALISNVSHRACSLAELGLYLSCFFFANKNSSRCKVLIKTVLDIAQLFPTGENGKIKDLTLTLKLECLEN